MALSRYFSLGIAGTDTLKGTMSKYSQIEEGRQIKLSSEDSSQITSEVHIAVLADVSEARLLELLEPQFQQCSIRVNYQNASLL
jgi:uncharacterized membrane protein